MHASSGPIVVAVLIACLVAAAAASCGGASSSVGAADAAGGDGSSSSASSSSSSSSSSSGGPDATTADATVDASTSDARGVTCGASECTREGDGKSRQVCCVVPGSPPSASCIPELAPNPCPNGGRRECDDRADCAPDNVCCAEQSNEGLATRCMPTCVTGVQRWQVCKTSADCEIGFPCTTNACPKQGPIGFCGAGLPSGCN
jgi:hypothetical protein